VAAGDLITEPWQVEWRGLLLGWPATSVTLSDLSGWLDLPAVRSGNVDRPSRHGGFPGQNRARQRVIEAKFTLAAEDPAMLPAIRAATALDEDPAEEPLVIWCGTEQPQLVFARVERRAVPTDHDFSVGHERATIQWVSTSALRYSVAEQQQAIGLPAGGSGGLVFPLVFPLTLGGGAGGGLMALENIGDAAAWPQWTVTGPVTGPIITNPVTGQRLVFDPAFVVAAGQHLVIDTEQRWVELDGVTRRDRLFTAEWFPLAKEAVTPVQFTSVGAYDAAASLTGRWRHSWM